MKKILILFLFFGYIGFGQTNGISYQALILDPVNQELPGFDNNNAPLANTNVCLKFSIVDELNIIEYEEIFTIKTDSYGMVNLIIGTESQTGGYASSFNDIKWSTLPKNLKIDLSVIDGCVDFTEISNAPFTSVPFALFAVSTQENPLVLENQTQIDLLTTLIKTNTDNIAINTTDILTKLSITDIVDDLTNGGTTVPLSAEQGKVLKNLIDTSITMIVEDRLTSFSTSNALSANQGRLLKGLVDSNEINIIANDADILLNSDKITKNTNDIANNATDIAANDANILLNSDKITKNTDDIANNATDIAANDADILLNSDKITKNTNDIANNATDIATNANDINTNTSDIATINTLTSGKIYLGDSSNSISETTITGDISISNTGVATIGNNVVDLTTKVTGVLPITNGGTGSTTTPMIGLITAANETAARNVLQLGTAATTDAIDYATASQGTKADSALQRTGGTMTGNINMGANNISSAGTITATTFSGNLNGTINPLTTATTQTAGDNSTKVATTAYVDAASTDDQTAAEVTSTATGNIQATTVQAALTELDNEKLAKAGGTMTGDINMGAKNISSAGTITATTFSGDLNGDLNGTINTATTATTQTAGDNSTKVATTAYVDAASTDQTAGEVTSTATGNLQATTVQAALAELEDEKLAKAGGTMAGDINMDTNNISSAGTITATTFSGNVTGDVTGNVTGEVSTINNHIIAGTGSFPDTVSSKNFSVSIIKSGSIITITLTTESIYTNSSGQKYNIQPVVTGIDASTNTFTITTYADGVAVQPDSGFSFNYIIFIN